MYTYWKECKWEREKKVRECKSKRCHEWMDVHEYLWSWAVMPSLNRGILGGGVSVLIRLCLYKEIGCATVPCFTSRVSETKLPEYAYLRNGSFGYHFCIFELFVSCVHFVLSTWDGSRTRWRRAEVRQEREKKTEPGGRREHESVKEGLPWHWGFCVVV